MVLSEESPVYGPFFGVMGAASAIIFSGRLSALGRKKKSKMEEICNFFIFGRKFRSSSLISILIMTLIIPYSPRSRIRNRQVWNWYRRDECHETWADYEIHHSRRHGWYYCYLRTRRCCPHRWSPRRTWKIHTLQVSNSFCNFSSSHMTEEKNQWNHSPLQLVCIWDNVMAWNQV